MKRLALVIFAALLFCGKAFAAPSDIVPQGAPANDWLAALAARGYLGKSIHPSDFSGDALHSRDQIGEILYSALVEEDSAAQIAKDSASAPLAYEAVRYFRAELVARNADVDELLGRLATKSPGYTVTAQPEQRLKAGGDTSSGSFLTYRAVAGGELSPSLSYVLSASNWAQDERRALCNDVGSRSFDALNEAYLRYDGYHGLDVRAGRISERWGPGMRGAELISDNVPAFDELRVAFPFSLGPALGRHWQYTQFASTFDDFAGRRYLSARRIERSFSSHWNFQFEEALKGSFSGSLLAAPVPFLIFKGFDLNYIDPRSNYNANLGLTYTANPNSRLYAQYFFDDFRSPFGGHKFFGLSLGNQNSVTPRRVGYLVGGTHQSGATGVTVEYAFADPTSNIFKNDNATWERARYDFIGMPNGPNTAELSGRLSQKLGQNLTLAAEYRNRRRYDNSFPAPTSRTVSLFGTYDLTQRQSVGLAYHDYRQDPFPYKPGDPGYPATNPFMPFSQADPGQLLRTRELDVTYKYTY